ncbi:MAG TPA: VOC family protein [Candidatus Limnocylindria bacterium]|jgi:catechol 2,3-dioxygenase-like lactoylglutathione lyase family enzyme
MPTPSVLGLHHVQVFCPEGGEATARTFYAGRLSLREVPKPASLRENGGCWFEAPGGGQIHISTDPDRGLHPRRHFALRVDDLDRMRAALEAQGVRSEDAAPITGWQRCYIFDPFGNKIELDQIDRAE